MAEHHLKTLPKFFEDLLAGRKTFELRSEADRTFAVGETLVLQEWDGPTCKYTGREIRRVVSHILRGPWFGLLEDHVILSFGPARQGHAIDLHRMEARMQQATTREEKHAIWREEVGGPAPGERADEGDVLVQWEGRLADARRRASQLGVQLLVWVGTREEAQRLLGALNSCDGAEVAGPATAAAAVPDSTLAIDLARQPLRHLGAFNGVHLFERGGGLFLDAVVLSRLAGGAAEVIDSPPEARPTEPHVCECGDCDQK